MAVDLKELSEAPASGGALVPPKYGVGDKCPNCGMAMKRLPSGEVACPGCGEGMKKAVGFAIDVELKNADGQPAEIQVKRGGTLVLEGYASTWMRDRDGDTVLPNAFEKSLGSYLEDNPVLLKDHDREKPIGLITKGTPDATGLLIRAEVPKPEKDDETWKHSTYNDIKRGIRRALSIGGVFYRGTEKAARNVIEEVDLFEISSVMVPSNPKSLFRVVAEKGLSFGETKEATAANNDAGDGEQHTHIKIGGGSLSHKHGDAVLGHAHPSQGLLPLLAAGAPDDDADDKHVRLVQAKLATWRAAVKAVNPDSDPGQLAQAVDAAIDEALEELAAGHSEQGYSLVLAADQAVDNLMEVLNVPDPDDGDDDEKTARKAAARSRRGSRKDASDLETCEDVADERDSDDSDYSDEELDAAADRLGCDDNDDESDESDDGKRFPVVDEKGTGTARLHVHVPIGGKEQSLPRKTGMAHSHSIDMEADGHRHEGFRPYSHPKTGGVLKMAETDGKKGAPEAEGGAKTVTLTEEQFKDFQAAQKRMADLETEQRAERLAEQIASEKMAKQEADEKAAQEHERKFMEQVASIVDAKLSANRSGRKFVVPASGGNYESAAHQQQKGTGIIDLLYRKAQGDPDARLELRDMSQKAAAEYGVKAMYEGATGGYLVPPQYMQQGIAEYRIAAAKVRQLCTVIGGIGTNLVYIPRETGIATVGWTAEGAPKPSTDQTFGQLAVNIFTLAGISKVSNQLLEDSSPAVDGLVRKDLGRLLGQAEDIAFITGTGAGQPTGILNTAGILTGAIGGASIADAIASAISALQSNYFGDPEAILMHPKHLNTIRTAKDTAGRYIFEPAFFPANSPMMRAFMENNGGGGPNGNLGGGFSQFPGQGGPQGSVWGLPVYADANIPTPVSAGNIIVGAFSEAYILERTGVTIDVSSEAGTSFEQNQTWFRGEERLGFTAARQPTAFYAVTGLP